MEHQSRTRLVTAIVLAAVFTTGVLLGLAADGQVSAMAAEVTAKPLEAGDSADAPRRARLYEQVGPNESQLARIDSIVAEYRTRTNALDEELRAEYADGFRNILLETRVAIQGVLSAEQAAEYQRLLDENDIRRAEERARNESGKG
jgi:hypothetical protein